MPDDQKPKRKPNLTSHAQQRKDEGRRVREALGDAQRAKQGDGFIDEKTGRYVVQTKRAHLKCLRSGKIRRVNDADLKQQIIQLETQSEGELIANWIDYPSSDNGEDYATVTFFVEAIHWHMVAVYNKKRLTDAYAC